MDRGDLAVPDPQVLVDDLHHGCEAVGGAGGGGDDRMLGRIVEMVVHADHGVQHIGLLHGSRDDHPLRAALQMPVEGRTGQELAGAFENHVHAQVAPRDFGGGGQGGEAEPLFADADRVLAFDRKLVAPAALHRVELEEMRHGGGAALDLVHMHDVQPVVPPRIILAAFRPTQGRPEGQAADAAHAVDADTHVMVSFAVPVAGRRGLASAPDGDWRR